MRKPYLLVVGALLLVLTGVATQSAAGSNDAGRSVTRYTALPDAVVMFGTLLLLLTGSANQSEAGVSLPPIMFTASPAVVVIPGTYVYMVPDIDVDVLFFQGYWWRPYEGSWHRSTSYGGRWRYVASERVPAALRKLPQDYRHSISPGSKRMSHSAVQKNWKKWENEKYWDRQAEQGSGGPGERKKRH